MASPRYDAIVVGSGPNGLTAAIVLARSGWSVLVVEARATIGGGARTEEWTLPGFMHDPCSAIHPMAAASPIFRELGLGLEWVDPPAPLAHPLDDGSALVLERSIEDTARGLGREGSAWRALLEPYVRVHEMLFEEILKPIRVPRHPLWMLRFASDGLRSCRSLCKRCFDGSIAPTLFAGLAAHSVLPLEAAGSASFGLVLALAAHAVGWPFPKGGSQAIAAALAAQLRALGAEIRTGLEVRSLADLPDSRAVLFDLTPRQVARIAGSALPPRYVRRLERFRHGPGVFKLDWALGAPIPWKNPACLRAATVHVGGSYEEIAAAEAEVARGRHPERPFVLVAQQSLFDPTRAPRGSHTGWAYCHVPNGSTQDMTSRIEGQIERMAPGFAETVLARRASGPAELERHNPNLIGGDVGGGANDLAQVLFRPFPRIDPYATPNRRLFLCSSSTPPGGGVHGMCGYWAARSVLSKHRGRVLETEHEQAGGERGRTR